MTFPPLATTSIGSFPRPGWLAKTHVTRAEFIVPKEHLEEAYDDATIVVKYGGHAMGDEQMARDFAKDMILLEQSGVNPVVVHGGGPQIGAMLKRLDIKSEFAASGASACSMVRVGTPTYRWLTTKLHRPQVTEEYAFVASAPTAEEQAQSLQFGNTSEMELTPSSSRMDSLFRTCLEPQPHMSASPRRGHLAPRRSSTARSEFQRRPVQRSTPTITG